MPSEQALRRWGCETSRTGLLPGHQQLGWPPKRLEGRTRAGESPVGGPATPWGCNLEYHWARETRWEAGRTTVQGKLLHVTDSAQYREGTVKSTPARGVKQILKPIASMQ